ncbi:MAG TPA: PRC-barrel domain-containing protein [Polyangia bacterium]|nr:PRC-barrel domain-containing protein [Polyangia bacterium]
MMHVRLDELRGKKVFDANGRVVGRVHAALIDMETWLVDTMRIAIARDASGDLDVPWSFWRAFWRPRTIDVATGQIHAAGDAILLRISLAELREAVPPSLEQFAAVH